MTMTTRTTEEGDENDYRGVVPVSVEERGRFRGFNEKSEAEATSNGHKGNKQVDSS